jgi:hypothetical protein
VPEKEKLHLLKKDMQKPDDEELDCTDATDKLADIQELLSPLILQIKNLTTKGDDAKLR